MVSVGLHTPYSPTLGCLTPQMCPIFAEGLQSERMKMRLVGFMHCIPFVDTKMWQIIELGDEIVSECAPLR